MMNTTIIICTPSNNSFCNTVKEMVNNTLNKKGKKCNLIYLYESALIQLCLLKKKVYIVKVKAIIN